MTILTNQIQTLRKSHHCRQQELADYLGVTRRTMSRIENGEAEPSLTTAWEIANFFGMKLDDVFRLENFSK